MEPVYRTIDRCTDDTMILIGQEHGGTGAAPVCGTRTGIGQCKTIDQAIIHQNGASTNSTGANRCSTGAAPVQYSIKAGPVEPPSQSSLLS